MDMVPTPALSHMAIVGCPGQVSWPFCFSFSHKITCQQHLIKTCLMSQELSIMPGVEKVWINSCDLLSRELESLRPGFWISFLTV